jgi:hypothetical protein
MKTRQEWLKVHVYEPADQAVITACWQADCAAERIDALEARVAKLEAEKVNAYVPAVSPSVTVPGFEGFGPAWNF